MATLNLPSTTIRKIVTQGGPHLTALADYLGKHGEFLLDPSTGNILYMDGATPGGILIAPSGGGSLTGFTSSLLTDPPNDTVNESVLTASGGSTDQDVVLVPTGLGAFTLAVATGDGAGGNKRGACAVDLQIFVGGKNSPTQVASGPYSFASGSANTASGFHSHAIGFGNIASDWISYAEGSGNLSSSNCSHAEGSGTTASGAYSHSEGASTTASGSYSHAEGQSTLAAGQASHAEGYQTTVTGDYAHAGGFLAAATSDSTFSHGVNTLADATASFATGQDSVTRGVRYMQAYGTGGFLAAGDQQAGRLCLKGHTTDSTTLQLTSNGGAPSTNNQFVVPAGASMAFTVTVLGRASSTGDSAMYTFTTLVKNDGGLTILSGLTTTATTLWNDDGAASWQCIGSVDTDNGALAVKVQGADATSIYWIAEVRSLELVIPVPP